MTKRETNLYSLLARGVAVIIFSSCLWAKTAAGSATNATSSGMVLDLGELSEDIKITPDYSNAVLKALLPRFSDVAKKAWFVLPSSNYARRRATIPHLAFQAACRFGATERR